MKCSSVLLEKDKLISFSLRMRTQLSLVGGVNGLLVPFLFAEENLIVPNWMCECLLVLGDKEKAPARRIFSVKVNIFLIGNGEL